VRETGISIATVLHVGTEAAYHAILIQHASGVITTDKLCGNKNV
jgi:hypothetical protein